MSENPMLRVVALLRCFLFEVFAVQWLPWGSSRRSHFGTLGLEGFKFDCSVGCSVEDIITLCC